MSGSVGGRARIFSYQSLPTDGSGKNLVSVFDLPADDTPLPAGKSPSSGQEFFYFSPAIARIAKPGYSYDDPNPRNFILHENRIPAKVIKCGEISVPAGSGKTATINTPAAFPLTPSTYMDYHVRRDDGETNNQWFYSPPMIYNANANDGIGFYYTVNTNSVVITNLCRFKLLVAT